MVKVLVACDGATKVLGLHASRVVEHCGVDMGDVMVLFGRWRSWI